MKIFEVKDRSISLINRLLVIWENSVKATHMFLNDEEISNIKNYVPEALKKVKHLIILEDKNKIPIAFMGVENKKLEMLFVENSERGKGIGKQLLTYGIENYGVNELTVNEQNPLALGFYEHMGFKTYKRTESDEQGQPYPILYMKI